MEIRGSVALVTGAGRGLGASLVEALLAAGASKVYAAARDVKRVSGSDPRVVPLTLDTTKAADVAAAAARASDVTLLVNNAGVLTSYDVLTTSPTELASDFRTNVYGTLDVIRAFVPGLERANGGACIVNVLSLAALASFPALGGYSASKAAAYSITQAMRPGLKARGIAVLAALPGPIDTDMVRALPISGKASPAETARGIVLGIARGDEEIYPDAMAQRMSALWSADPKGFERAFGAM
ncbi:MAG: SDR family NAD(P)-dependent oxidoreductase [Sandaracinus sp.]